LLYSSLYIPIDLSLQVEVYKKPVVAILSTGNELVDLQLPHMHQYDGGGGGIFDTNRPSLQALLEGKGYKVVDLGITPDELSLSVYLLHTTS
jgi:gephyrin